MTKIHGFPTSFLFICRTKYLVNLAAYRTLIHGLTVQGLIVCSRGRTLETRQPTVSSTVTSDHTSMGDVVCGAEGRTFRQKPLMHSNRATRIPEMGRCMRQTSRLAVKMEDALQQRQVTVMIVGYAARLALLCLAISCVEWWITQMSVYTTLVVFMLHRESRIMSARP